MTKKQAAHEAVRLLKEAYPDAICSLEYRKPHELMIATRLAAQCTDARVNIVCVDLFDKYRSVRDFAEANLTDVEEIIKSCGLYKTKAHDIIAMCQMLMEKYNGELPDTVEELTKLPGIGRKTANLVVGDVFHKPAIVCDTHCIRITNLLGLTEGPCQGRKSIASAASAGGVKRFLPPPCFARTRCLCRAPSTVRRLRPQGLL